MGPGRGDTVNIVEKIARNENKAMEGKGGVLCVKDEKYARVTF